MADNIINLARTARRQMIFPDHKLLGLMLKHHVLPSTVGSGHIYEAYDHFQDYDVVNHIEYLRGAEDCCGPEVHRKACDRLQLEDQLARWCVNTAAAGFDPNEDLQEVLDRLFAEILQQPASLLWPEPEAEPAPTARPPPPQPIPRLIATTSVAVEQLPVVETSLAPADIAARNLKAALDLARAGIPTFPVRLNWNSEKKKWEKPPAIDGWQRAPTTDPEHIRAWWRDLSGTLSLPTHHLVPGIWCGHPELRFIVIDADRHGGPDGVDAFDSMVAQRGLPAGPVTKTANDGWHYIFRKPDREEFGDQKGSLPDGIDVKGSGFIVGPGAVRPDGAMWRSADGVPSLIEAFRNNGIPTLPGWLAEMIRAPKPTKAMAPAREGSAEQEATLDNATSPSAKRATKVPIERGRSWAAAALTGSAAEVAAARPGVRNNLTNALAYHMARMVPPGWITEQAIIDAFMRASEANGKIADDGGPGPILATLASAITAGQRKPRTTIPDGPWKPWQPGHDDNWWLLGFRSEIRALYRMRHPNNPAAVDAADERLEEIIKATFDPWQIGEELRLTFEEYQRLAKEAHGRKSGARLPAKMRPCDVSEEAVDTFLKDRKRAQNRATQAKQRAKDQAEQAAIEALDDQESAILAFIQTRGPKTTRELVEGLKRAKAFAACKSDQARRNAILRCVKQDPSGKPPLILNFLSFTETTTGNGRTTYIWEARAK